MIVVFGGAFNPITNAHLEVYKYVNKKFSNVKFVFLPVSSAYTKSDLVSNYHRVNMLALATKEYDNIIISEIEIDDTDYLGTYQSLIRISDKFGEDVAFVVGADNLFGMHKWLNIEGLLSEFKIIVMERNNIDIRNAINCNPVLKRNQDSFIVCDDFEMNVSSTLFRETYDSKMVPKDVYNYIIDNELYRGDDDVQE